MGRKYKHLYPELCTFENLWIASRKSRRGKRHKFSTLEFEYDLERELLEIQAQLQAETFTFSSYNTFMVHDPKDRLIHAAPYRDRVVHHAMVNILEPILDSILIHDSYACRMGKGSHRANERAHGFLRVSPWVLKLDIQKYFFTIDHEILLSELAKKISDPCFLNLISRLLATYTSGTDYYFPFDDDDLFSATRPRGLPIGNLTSQWFANYFLNPVDRFIKETLQIKRYVRYMDDLLIFADSKKEVKEAKTAISGFLAKRRLRLHKSKSQIVPARQGIKFLGFHLYPTHRRILRENLKRFKKRMHYRRYQYAEKQIDMEKLRLSLNGWLGFADQDRHRRFINQILKHIRFQEPYPLTGNFTFFCSRGTG